MTGSETTDGAARPASPRRAGFRFPTAILLTCAALGVAGGLLLAPANWLSTILFPGLPFVSVGLAGLWLLTSVIALRLLRRPLVGLLVGLLAGLVIMAAHWVLSGPLLPVFIVAVMVDEPTVGGHYGGVVAAPVPISRATGSKITKRWKMAVINSSA